LPEDEKAQGLFRIASTPPNDDTFLTTRIWKRFGMKVERPTKPFDHNENKDVNDRIVAKMKKMVDAAKTQQGGSFRPGELTNPDAISIQRFVPLQRGKWRIMPPGVKADSP
jgi:hypothetical protein